MPPTATTAARPALSVSPRIRAKLPFVRFELVGLLLGALLLNFWDLSRSGYGNEYYAAAIRSMGSSWHLFLYESFDPAGVMTVDKPPLFLWVQVASMKLFGLNSWALLGPQALMGAVSVWLVYDLTRRRFGRPAGFIAGVILALTPICVAVFRHNNPDALLVLCCTAALWFVVRGLDDGRWRWLIFAGVAVGLGFETKMAAALLVVPALAIAWFWVAPRGRVIATGQLVAGGVVMTVVGLAWPLLVWLTPARSRPWISGTDDNSVWSLLFGYNGVGRLAGQAGGAMPTSGTNAFAGDPGPFRLLNISLGPQIGWFLAVAVVAGIAILLMTRLRRSHPQTGWLLAVGGSALTIAFVFSFAGGIFHPYYTSLLGPFIACLAGAAVTVFNASSLLVRILGAATFAITAVVEAALLARDENQARVGLYLLVAVFCCAIFLIGTVKHQTRRILIGGCFSVLILAPAGWSFQTTGGPFSGTFPYGGPPVFHRYKDSPDAQAHPPVLARQTAPHSAQPIQSSLAMTASEINSDPRRASSIRVSQDIAFAASLAYAKQHGGGTLVTTSQVGQASKAIIQAGANVAAIGGFSGRQSMVSLHWFADAVADHKIRWVLRAAPPVMRPWDARTGSAAIFSAAQRYCALAMADIGLYDCGGSVKRLRGAAQS